MTVEPCVVCGRPVRETLEGKGYCERCALKKKRDMMRRGASPRILMQGRLGTSHRPKSVRKLGQARWEGTCDCGWSMEKYTQDAAVTSLTEHLMEASE